MSCTKIIIKDKMWRSEVQLKIPRTYYLSLIRMATIKKPPKPKWTNRQKITNTGKVEKLEHLCIVGGNIKWYNC